MRIFKGLNVSHNGLKSVCYFSKQSQQTAFTITLKGSFFHSGAQTPFIVQIV